MEISKFDSKLIRNYFYEEPIVQNSIKKSITMDSF